MLVITETPERTTTTPAATVAALAGPSQGSQELSSWRVRLPAGSAGPVHAIDREQVWMPVSGALAVTIDGTTSLVAAGEAAILPAGVIRQVSAADGPAEALVCMGVGGQATLPGSDVRHRLPWAE